MNSLLRPLFGAVLAGTALTASAFPLLSLTASPATVSVGAIVNIELLVSGLGDHTAPSLGAFDVIIAFNPALLSPAGVAFDTGLGDPNASPPEAYPSADTSVAGTIHLINTSLLEANAANCIFCLPPYLDDLQGSAFRLATLTFTGDSPGTTVMSLTINALADAQGEALDTNIQGTAVTVVGTPEPGSLMLFALGCAGLSGFARRGGGARGKIAALDG
ncbi:PEP-CTERM sorting domain-containing protein [Candidatus Thiodictyon syntrophicum]|jgi:hypothetical protein|uniref:Ice-binding protein C-terminal domain-containing protein n=1 Tax=Candidatus Thiodictyon syntrophicum TaxID=1166950 RepID=A0A2K8U6H3_9GAMM|nr:PEP-CTERM sorting domain-containing protein [Candidatus Thiodictyon syntrophicum]AUB81198.1 hypothetical protein THSYN_09705 [Candidatus Thiodictyon syntrophicum]